MSESPRDLAQAFLKKHKLAFVVAEHRRNGRDIQRQDYYEFIDPSREGDPKRRRLSDERINIIASDIAVPSHDAKNDYLARGGALPVRKRRSAA